MSRISTAVLHVSPARPAPQCGPARLTYRAAGLAVLALLVACAGRPDRADGPPPAACSPPAEPYPLPPELDAMALALDTGDGAPALQAFLDLLEAAEAEAVRVFHTSTDEDEVSRDAARRAYLDRWVYRARPLLSLEQDAFRVAPDVALLAVWIAAAGDDDALADTVLRRAGGYHAHDPRVRACSLQRDLDARSPSARLVQRALLDDPEPSVRRWAAYRLGLPAEATHGP